MKNIINTLFICLFLLVVIQSCNAKIEYIPETLYELSLTKKVTGDEAKEFVNRLHLSNVTDIENIIGYYSGKLGDAVIYLTIYNTKTDAVADQKKMEQKISPSNSVFSPVMYKTILGKPVGYTYGMGQTHFIFSHENVLFWISTENHWSDNFIEYYFEYVLKI